MMPPAQALTKGLDIVMVMGAVAEVLTSQRNSPAIHP
jgi:hypothetical protein